MSLNSNPTSISFVIVTMNRKDVLRNCLQSIVAQSCKDKEIIVVDNGSTDGTAEMVQQEFPEAQLSRQTVNHGAGGGRNIGTELATNEFVLYFDDDQVLEGNDATEKVIQYFKDYPKVGVLGLRMVDPATNKTCPSSIPRRDLRMMTKNSYIATFYGGSCAIRKTAFNEAGKYWGKLDPYGAEDNDLACRLINLGYDILWTHDISLLHYETPVARPKGRKTYHFARNHPLYALRNLPWLYVLSHYILWWGRSFLCAAKNLQFGAFFKGVAASIYEIPDVLKDRQKISSEAVAKLKQYSGRLWY